MSHFRASVPPAQPESGAHRTAAGGPGPEGVIFQSERRVFF
jgi:hypothetical protein